MPRYVDLYQVLVVARRRMVGRQQELASSLLLCPVWRGLPVLRQGKWAASYSDIPRGTTSYPTGCSGWLYVTTPATAARLTARAAQVPVFWIDDVWVTGFLAKDLAITHLELNSLWTMSTASLLLAKCVQNPVVHHRDYLAGPTNRSGSLLLLLLILRDPEVASVLHTKARWCALQGCKNNIYREEEVPEVERGAERLLKRFFPPK